MKRGFGAGMYADKNSRLPAESLQRIKYIGDKYESAFRARGIETQTDLIERMSDKSKEAISTILKGILTRSNRVLDTKAYNSVILYLYKNGVRHAPACKKLGV